VDIREILELDHPTRVNLWQDFAEILERYFARVHETSVAPDVIPEEIRARLKPFDFSQPLDPRETVNLAVESLWNYQVHTPHPRYFGLFNPAPTTMGIVGDAIAAAFNPQVATWNHSPFAVELEQHLIRSLGVEFGYEAERVEGTFTSGGTEANHTAILTALERSFADFAREGTRGLTRQPLIYVSNQSHHSFIRAARISGLGSDAVRHIEVNDNLQIKVEPLIQQIERDRAGGGAPFVIVANAGTTNAGVIDTIAPLAEVASQQGLWLHVDAAWGGAAAFVPELKHLFRGIERSDSLTFDAHTWLSVPMGAGIYLTRHPEILRKTFRITAEYMPVDAAELDAVDPYAESIQWSRRFIGLKVFLSLAVAGWEGYRKVIRHQVAMGELLRQELRATGWKILNHTRLPLVCFVDQKSSEGRTEVFLDTVAREVVSSGKAWISFTRLDKNRPVLRACVTNFRTGPEDIRALVQALGEARRKLSNHA
jgi:glutamate/tyrosine decarboxylase-like PLP-dependent enzyme